jgi:hypothetical protein
MLPAGPRYTFGIPSTPQLNTRQLATQILSSMQGQIAAATELRVGTITPGCDGLDNINPLNGTTCNGAVGSACSVVLYNPQSRTVVANGIGRAMASSTAACAPGNVTVLGASGKTTVPADCAKVTAALLARRRFVDNLGNWYGPTGAWLSQFNAPAQLESDYVHRMTNGFWFSRLHDPPEYITTPRVYLEKTYEVGQELLFASTSGLTSVNDIDASNTVVTTPFDLGTPSPLVLEDCLFGGTYDTTGTAYFVVTISSLGSLGVPDTFSWIGKTGTGNPIPSPTLGSWGVSLGSGTNIPITGGSQALAHGVEVTFGSTNGHSLNRVIGGTPYGCAWIGTVGGYNSDIVRPGVAVRGTIATATACVNGGFPNNNVLLTCEDDLLHTGHYYWDALVVRDPDSLAQLYRLPLDHDGTFYDFGDPPRKFSFSTNDEGLFFMHCYTTPVLASPPTPYPGHEYGAPNPRKIAVVSVNPLTFVPTIQSLITLEDNEYTAGSSFAIAITAP